MKIETGDTVVVVYDGQLDNGEIFESSASSGPLEFTIGDGSVMPGFEAEIIGMGQGEKKSFALAPDTAHGPSNPELIHTVERGVLPNQGQLAVGMVLGLTIDHEGKKEKVPALVTALDDQQVTVDFNHPLAGKTLTYTVTVQSIKKNAPPQ
jgi:FKBP-type peptidyl-prolyl cis-trans isomerase 2